MTIRGNSVDPDDANYRERFLLYSGQEGKLLIFAAETELQTLHQSDYIICDGTFEMAPQSSYQLYTLHGMYHGEGLALAMITCEVMPNKTKATYIEFFTGVKEALVNK